MINLKKILVFALFLVLLISISACGKKDVKKAIEDIRTGSEGISVSFLPNNPPATIHVEKADLSFDIFVELNNKGAYPQPDEIATKKLEIKVYLGGYDRNILGGVAQNQNIIAEIPDMNRLPTSLIGKSLVNLNGGSDIVTFKGNVKFNQLNVEKYEPTLLATICYKYYTEAGPSVCIDPDPYSTVTQKKVCEVQDTSLSSQGAPIAVTRIDEEAFQEKTQFKLTIKNVGGGDVLREDAIQKDKCNPFGTDKIKREDVDKVKLENVKIGDKDLLCSPFAEGDVEGKNGIIRLVNGEGYIICKLEKTMDNSYKSSGTSYTTPIKITLSYGYRTTAQRTLQIKKELSRDTPQTTP